MIHIIGITALIALAILVALAVAWYYGKLRQFTIGGAIVALVTGGLFGANMMTSQASAQVMLQQSITHELDTTNKTVMSYQKACASSEALTAICAQINKNTTAIKALQKSANSGGEVAKGTKVSVATAKDTKPANVAKQLAAELAQQGWRAGDVSVGTVDWSKDKFDEGPDSFGNGKQLRTQAEVAAYLNGTSTNARAARAMVLKSVPKTEQSRVLSGAGYLPVQFNKDVCLTGNGFITKSGTVGTDNKTCHKAGDVVWVYVNKAGAPVWGATVRADCWNPHLSYAPQPVLCPSGTDMAGLAPGKYGCSVPMAIKKTVKVVQICNINTGKLVWVPENEVGNRPRTCPVKPKPAPSSSTTSTTPATPTPSSTSPSTSPSTTTPSPSSTTTTTPPTSTSTPPPPPSSSSMPPKCPPGDTDPACHSLPPGSSGTPTNNPPSLEPVPTHTGPTYNPTQTSTPTVSSTTSSPRPTPPNEGPGPTSTTATGGPTKCGVCG